MDKGIRPFCNAKFMELLPQRATLGNTGFRKAVIAEVMENFGTTLASAATHYNHAFKECRKVSPELVADLGRAEDKKGGRKAKLTAKEVTGETVPHPDDQTVFAVKKKADGSVIAEGLTFEAARALVDKAAKAKKARLYFL